MFDISLLVPGLPFDGDTLENHSLGGSETAGLYMAKALAARGAHVKVFCGTDKVSEDSTGAQYFPLQLWPQYATCTPHDVAIVQRAPERFGVAIESRLNVLWQHDLAHHRSANGFRGTMWNIDKVLLLSQFMIDQYEQVVGKHPGLYHKTRNGIDWSMFENPPQLRRDPNVMLYCARPERGLDILLQRIFPLILKENPNAQLWVAGYDNPVPHFASLYQGLSQAATRFGDRVRNLGALTKRELYAVMAQAGVYTYPTPSPVMPDFSEVSCILAMEAQAAGLPIVTSRRGALPETIAPEAGILIEGEPTSPTYAEEFASAVLRYMRHPDLARSAGEAGRARGITLDWLGVADDWLRMFESEIRAKSADTDRVIRHAWRTSDIMLARQMTAKDEALTAKYRPLLEPFDFVDTPDGFRKHYEKLPEEIPVNKGVVDRLGTGLRYQAAAAFMRSQPAIANMLDYGAAWGEYSLGLGRDFPRLTITGIDIDKNRTKLSTELAALAGLSDRVHFFTDDLAETTERSFPVPTGGYDMVMMQEVLEHVAEPWLLAERVEKQAKEGGWVYISVPFGPWEYSSYHTYPHRCHIWHFDAHDLRDMFGAKPDFAVDALYQGQSPELGSAMGWWIVRYRADHKTVPQIDMARKRWLQRPRQTVSASIIAGPNSEETLHWSLRSILHIADEVIIADCGMSEEAKHVALEYAMPVGRYQFGKRFTHLSIIDGTDPRADGFERSRNIALDACRSDWVFWIDTDERVVAPTEAHKYLRDNVYHGYGVRQHHFACDTNFSPDMPVRFFRRRPELTSGKVMRFYGAIHEHPELGLNGGPGPVIVMSDVHIAHVGYLTEGIRKDRFVRNFPLLKLDQERYPDRLLQKHFIMRDNIHLIKFAMQQNGNVIDEHIKAKARETRELYRKYFLGKPHYMNSDSLQYYSDANTVLGEGFDVVIQLDADKFDAKPTPPAHYRYASKEDLLADLSRRVSDKVDVFEKPYY